MPDAEGDRAFRFGLLAEEQAALRRVATLVADGVSPEALFSAVSDEVGRLFGVEAAIARFEPDGSAMVVVGLTGGIPVVTIGARWELEEYLASTAVYRTGRPARSDHTRHRQAPGPVADSLRKMDFVSTVAAPIVVEGRVWGVMTVNDKRKPLPPDTEERVEEFTELVATAIANAESRARLAASEARARQLAREQAALRRVATLVAEGVSAEELFSAVSVEIGQLFGVEAVVARYEPDGSAIVVVGQTAGIPSATIGTPLELGNFLASHAVYQTGRAARSDHTRYRDALGPVAGLLRELGTVCTVGAPIMVERRLWGVMVLVSHYEPMPPDTEERVAKFTELVGTAIANIESRAELASSEAQAHDLAATQATLRRVATLVAEGTTADELFAAVAREVTEVIAIPVVGLCRFDADDTFTVVGVAGETSFTVGSRWPVTEDGLAGMIRATGRPTREDNCTTIAGPFGSAMGEDRMIATVGVPIVVEGATWGLIVGAARPGEPIPDGTEERLARFTQLVATAIANSQAREHLARLAAEQAALRRVATLVAEDVPSGELFGGVAGEVGMLFRADFTAMIRYESDPSFVTTMAFWAAAGEHPSAPSRPRTVPGDPPWMLAGSGKPTRIDDWTDVPGPIAEFVHGQLGVKSSVGCPVVVEGRLWGGLAVHSKGEPFPPDTEARLLNFTELVATAIANSQASEDLARLAEEQAALRRVATLVAGGAPPADVLSVVSDEVGRLFGSDQAAVARYEPDGSGAVFVGVSRETRGVAIGTRWPLENFLALTTVYRTGRSVTKERSDYETVSGPIADSLRAMNFVSRIAAPIIVEGNLWGVMTVNDAHERLAPDAEQRVAKFTELVATAIANAESRSALAASEVRARDLAREQAALRRVATLVAKEAKLEEVFSAVAEEVEDVLDIPVVTLCRCESDGFVIIRSRGMPAFPAGSRWPWDVPSLPALIYQTGQPARIDDFTHAVGSNAAARDAGVTAAVGVPIVVAGTAWGSICAATTRDEPLPSETEDRLGQFRELIATSIANAIMREQLAASRARVIAAADDARRRIERDLHDGAQQRFVTLAVALRRAEARISSSDDALRADVTRIAEGLTAAVEELRELSRGIHPAVLTEGGLAPALKALGRRSAVRVKLDVRFDYRLPDQVEVAAYYTISEALTNASKHSGATRVWVSLQVEDEALHLVIRDDGAGGADASRGSGLIGLRDRIEALGGTIQIRSPRGSGTSIEAQIPIRRSFDP
jgi:GAF domain-containing protein